MSCLPPSPLGHFPEPNINSLSIISGISRLKIRVLIEDPSAAGVKGAASSINLVRGWFPGWVRRGRTLRKSCEPPPVLALCVGVGDVAK